MIEENPLASIEANTLEVLDGRNNKSYQIGGGMLKLDSGHLGIYIVLLI